MMCPNCTHAGDLTRAARLTGGETADRLREEAADKHKLCVWPTDCSCQHRVTAE